MADGSHGDGWVVFLAAVCSVALYAYLLERARGAHAVRTFRGAEEPWWFGYARDAVSLIGAAALVLTYHIAGFSDHLALLLGALAALVEWGIHEAVAEKFQFRTAFVSTAASSLVVMAPTLLYPSALSARLDRLISALF